MHQSYWERSCSLTLFAYRNLHVYQPIAVKDSPCGSSDTWAGNNETRHAWNLHCSPSGRAVSIARKGGKVEARLSLATHGKPLAAGKGEESGELAWRCGLIAGSPCLLDFSASRRKKTQRSFLPGRVLSGGRPRVTRRQQAIQPSFEVAALTPGLTPPHDIENGHSRCFSPP